MIDQETKNQIVNEVVEKVLLYLPEVIGTLINQHAAKIKLNKEFYEKYPEFKNYKNIVAATIEEIEESKTNFTEMDKLLEESVPKIRERINKFKNLDMKKVEFPKLSIHGEL